MTDTDPEKPKSILKKPTKNASILSDADLDLGFGKPKPTRRSDKDAREIAVAHARILQHRKDLEAQILDSIIALSTYPPAAKHSSSPSSSSSSSSASPAASDAASFKSHVRLFQPSDYDDLVAERNTNGLCGYALCARPRVRHAGAGEWKLVSGRGIMRKAELEKWCSEACARRALYVKVQLNETAAWERAGIPDLRIELLDEEDAARPESGPEQVARGLNLLKLDDSAALALERGEGQMTGRGVGVNIQENTVLTPAVAPSLAEGQNNHLIMEGHMTKFGSNAANKTAGQV